MAKTVKCCDQPGFGPFLGRALISVLFLFAAIGKIAAFGDGLAVLRDNGIMGAHAFLIIAIVLELSGGLLILFGFFTRLGTWILIVYLLPVTIIFHPFWRFEDIAFVMQFSHFLKNVTIFGGLTLLNIYGPGSWSFDAKRCK